MIPAGAVGRLLAVAWEARCRGRTGAALVDADPSARHGGGGPGRSAGGGRAPAPPAPPWFARRAGGQEVTVGDSRDAVSGAPVAVVAAPVRGPSGSVAGALVTTLAVRPLAPPWPRRSGGPSGGSSRSSTATAGCC